MSTVLQATLTLVTTLLIVVMLFVLALSYMSFNSSGYSELIKEVSVIGRAPHMGILLEYKILNRSALAHQRSRAHQTAPQDQDAAVAETIRVMKRRVELLELPESSVELIGEDRIVVKLLSHHRDDLELASRSLGQRGLLHFQVVEYEAEPKRSFFQHIQSRRPTVDQWPRELAHLSQGHRVHLEDHSARSTSREILEYMIGEHFDQDTRHEIGFKTVYVNPQSAQLDLVSYLLPKQRATLRKQSASLSFDPSASVAEAYELYYLRREGMSVRSVSDASVGEDIYRRPITKIQFTERDAERFANLTAEHTQQQLAIMIDDQVYADPMIRERIGGGIIQLSSGVSVSARRDAEALVMLLKSAPLPLELKLLSQRAIKALSDRE